MNQLSQNNRHDTVNDVRVFLEREAPDRARTVEVVCSSARRDMDRQSNHVPFRLFSETLALFPECASPGHSHTVTGWPTSTSLCCWHDCHPFTGTPIPIPKSKRTDASGKQQYHVYGVVCSANCGVAFILEKNTYDQQIVLLLFKSMMIDVFGLPPEDVFALEPAAPRIFLTMFGGHLNIDEFRARSLSVRSTLLTPPFISYSMVLEENARVRESMHADARVDGSIAPISSHVIRGLRRPTKAVVDDEDDVPMEGEGTGAAETKPSMFELFLRNKLDRDACVAEDKPPAVAAPKPAPRKAAKSKRAKEASASEAVQAPPAAAMQGTLAAYLAPC